MSEESLSKGGLSFILPEFINDQQVSVIEVGPFNESGLAKKVNTFLNTNILGLFRTNSYILLHDKNIENLDSLIKGKPFVDPIIHSATLNSSLVLKKGKPFDYVLQSMLNPGTSDAEGMIALEQALLSLGKKPGSADLGFSSKQYFLTGSLSSEKLEEVSQFLANPELHARRTFSKSEFKRGQTLEVPVVGLKSEIKVEKYDVANMTPNELLGLNNKRKLAASPEEMIQFQEIYKDKDFIAKRKKLGLDHRATDVELETWFSLRSEHCFHKEFNAEITLDDKLNDPIFKRAFKKGWLTRNNKGKYLLEDGLFKTFIQNPAESINSKLEKRGKNWIASMFEDNSGVVYYDENYMFCIKFETHNSPTNKEPVQGAKTGIDGVNRDIFGTMRGTFDAIANFFYYCMGHPDYKGWLPKGVKHPYVVLQGATRGVREGGNEMQIPTLGGGMVSDPRFIAKVLLYAGTVGWSPVKSPNGKIDYTKSNPKPNDSVFVIGQPVGIDGIHGATESSLSASANISLGHVQADYSFIQAKMKELYKEAARRGLFTEATDCGAVGIGSATHELARATNGLFLDLAKHPVKYKGIQPFQINISETQDRMVATIRPGKEAEFFALAMRYDVPVANLGKLNNSGFIQLNYKNETVGLLDINKLFNKEPKKKMHGTWNPSKIINENLKTNYSLEETLCKVMELPDVASKEWFFRQKDSSVKGGTILGPLLGLDQEVEADATIQKPLDTEGKDFGAIAYAQAITPKLSDIDPYLSAQRSFVDMVGKIIAIGGRLPNMNKAEWDAWAVCGNYCQPNSDSTTTLTRESGEHNLASLVREGIGVREAIEELNIPVISGKDSMKCSCVYEVDDSFKLEDVPVDLRRHVTFVEDERSGKRKIEIHDPDTYLASASVKIQDYRKCVDSSFKQEGDLIYLIGTTKNHMGASAHNQAMGYEEQGAPLTGGKPPQVDFNEFKKIAYRLNSAFDEEVLASCSYIHNGGLATAVSKAAMAGKKGVDLNLSKMKDFEDESEKNFDKEKLFSETPGRFIVSIDPKDKKFFEDLMNGVNYKPIGKVKKVGIINVQTANRNSELIFLDKVKKSYQTTLRFDLDSPLQEVAK